MGHTAHRIELLLIGLLLLVFVALATGTSWHWHAAPVPRVAAATGLPTFSTQTLARTSIPQAVTRAEKNESSHGVVRPTTLVPVGTAPTDALTIQAVHATAHQPTIPTRVTTIEANAPPTQPSVLYVVPPTPTVALASSRVHHYSANAPMSPSDSQRALTGVSHSVQLLWGALVVLGSAVIVIVRVRPVHAGRLRVTSMVIGRVRQRHRTWRAASPPEQRTTSIAESVDESSVLPCTARDRLHAVAHAADAIGLTEVTHLLTVNHAGDHTVIVQLEHGGSEARWTQADTRLRTSMPRWSVAWRAEGLAIRGVMALDASTPAPWLLTTLTEGRTVFGVPLRHLVITGPGAVAAASAVIADLLATHAPPDLALTSADPTGALGSRLSGVPHFVVAPPDLLQRLRRTSTPGHRPLLAIIEHANLDATLLAELRTAPARSAFSVLIVMPDGASAAARTLSGLPTLTVATDGSARYVDDGRRVRLRGSADVLDPAALAAQLRAIPAWDAPLPPTILDEDPNDDA